MMYGVECKTQGTDYMRRVGRSTRMSILRKLYFFFPNLEADNKSNGNLDWITTDFNKLLIWGPQNPIVLFITK